MWQSPHRMLAACLFFATVLSACMTAHAQSTAFQPYESTIANISSALASEVTCVEIVQAFVSRIHAYDPHLGAFVTLDVPGALAKAKQLDAAVERGVAPMPLQCVPIVVKDNFNTAGVATSAGVLAMQDSVPPLSANVVLALEKSGAIVLGKANMPDLAVNGMNTNSSVKGQTLNPYNNAVTPYGSSGGPAVATASSFCVFALGTDTDGSIQNPAAAASLYGLRTTQGLIDKTGVVPLSWLQDTVGPLTRTAEDLAVALDVMNGSSVYTKSLKGVANMDNMRVGFIRLSLAQFDTPIVTRPSASVIATVNATLARMTAAGATVLDITNVTMFQEVFDLIQAATSAGADCGNPMFHWAINQYYAALGERAPVASLAELVKTEAYMADISVFLQQALNSSASIPPSKIASCVQYTAGRQALADYLEAFIRNLALDAIMYPSANQPPPPLTQLNPPPTGLWLLNIISAVSGLPALVAPMGLVAPDQTVDDSDVPVDAYFDWQWNAWRRTSLSDSTWRMAEGASDLKPSVQSDSDGVAIGLTMLGLPQQDANLVKVAYAAEVSGVFSRVAPSATPPVS